MKLMRLAFQIALAVVGAFLGLLVFASSCKFDLFAGWRCHPGIFGINFQSVPFILPIIVGGVVGFFAPGLRQDNKWHWKQAVWIFITIAAASIIGIALVLYGAYGTGFSNGISIVSKPAAASTPVATESLNVVMTYDVGRRLSDLYVSSQNEFFACLNGEQKGRNVTFYSISDIRYGSERNVSSAVSCDFAIVHSHPSGTCGFSCRDMLSFTEIAKDLNTAFSVVVCGDRKYAIVSGASALASEQDTLNKCGAKK